MYYFTSINAYYLGKARILASTLKEADKNAKFILVLSDDLPDNFTLEDEPFDDVIFPDKLDEFDSRTFFKYNVTELCTAVKPYSAKYIMEKYNADSVCYLDPDIQVFSDLIELKDILKTYSIVVTPHGTTPEEKSEFIIGNEILFLKRGTFNFGFFAVKNDEEGIRFLNWWHSRLKQYCVDDKKTAYQLTEQAGYLGCFTDQKWGDLIPSFFDNYYVLKHPGYNLSTWNLTTKTVEYKNGEYLINGKPLRFFHFSGFDSRAHHSVLDYICQQYPHLEIIKTLSREYEALHTKMITADKPKEWKYARFKSGEKINDAYRRIYLIRTDINDVFPDPFDDVSENNFRQWADTEYDYMLYNKECNIDKTMFKPSEDIAFYFDRQYIDDKKLEVKGWAFISTTKQTGKVYLGFKNKAGEDVFFKTNTRYRHDVVDCYKEASLLKCGFSLYADVNECLTLASIILDIQGTLFIKN